MRFLKILSSLAMLALLLFGARIASAQDYDLPEDGTPIAEVRVEGLHRLPPADILKRMELKAGGNFDRGAYRRDLQSISDLGKINPIRLQILWKKNDDGKLVLTVQVEENPVIRSIRFVGNSRFKDAQLLSELTYREGEISSTEIRSATARNLRSFYREGGYKGADVDVIVQPVSGEDNAVDVIIQIDEGNRLKISSVRFIGAEHFSSLYLRTQIHNAPGILFFSNYYDKSLIEDDVAIIRTLYQNAGYLDAEVSLADLVDDEEGKKVRVVFDITEGSRYTVGAVTTEGVSYFTPEEVDRITKDMTGRYFKGRRLAKALDGMRTLYGNQGYIDTEIGYRLDKDPGKNLVTVVLQIQESPVVYVGDVRVQMEDYQYEAEPKFLDRTIDWLAPPIKEEVIRKEVRLKPGEKFRTANEVRTVERLRNLGIFRKVEVVHDPTTDPQVRDAVIVVDEDPAAAFFGVTAGIGEYSGPALTFMFEQPNVGGRADRFSASATIGTKNQAFRLRYFDRYLGNSQTSLDNQIYYLTDRYRGYRERTLGASTEFGHPFSEHLTGLLRFRLERVSYSNTSDEAEEKFDAYWVAAVRPMLVYDRRDNIQYPTRGYLISGGVETGAADGFLMKALHAYEWYKKPFSKRDIVYAYQHTVGLMPYDATEIGLGERFFAGGANSVRGFKVHGIGPRDPGDKDIAIGGATRITQRHELRFPLVERVLIGRVFTDAAILEKGPLQLGTPRIGSGVGATINFGAISASIDFAVPLLKESRDESQFFHLRLGSNF